MRARRRSLHPSAIKRPSKSEGETAAAGARYTLAFFSGITHTYKGEIIWPIAPHANSKQLPPPARPIPAENKRSREKRDWLLFLSLPGWLDDAKRVELLLEFAHALTLTYAMANLLDSTLNARELCLPPDELPALALSLSSPWLQLFVACCWNGFAAGLERGLRKSAVCGKRRVTF